MENYIYKLLNLIQFLKEYDFEYDIFKCNSPMINKWSKGEIKEFISLLEVFMKNEYLLVDLKKLSDDLIKNRTKVVGENLQML